MSVCVCALIDVALSCWICSMRSLIFALLKASLLISEEPMVLMELRLRSLSESLLSEPSWLDLRSESLLSGPSWLELRLLDEAVDSCPLEPTVGVASGMTSVATSGLASVATWLGRYC